MKTFMAIYTGTPEKLAAFQQLEEKERARRDKAGFDAWMKWGKDHAASIVEMGAPLGKTKRIDARGITDVKNNIAGYIVVQAESHEEAARMFLEHPHFTIFPGDAVEIMECLPIPER